MAEATTVPATEGTVATLSVVRPPLCLDACSANGLFAQLRSNLTTTVPCALSRPPLLPSSSSHLPPYRSWSPGLLLCSPPSVFVMSASAVMLVAAPAPHGERSSSRSDSSSTTSSSGSRSTTSHSRHSRAHSPSMHFRSAPSPAPLWQAILPASDSHLGQRCVMRGVWCVCGDDAENSAETLPALSLGPRATAAASSAVVAQSPTGGSARIVLLQVSEVAAVMQAQAASVSSSSASSTSSAPSSPFLPAACPPGVLLVPHHSAQCRFVLLHTSLSAAPGMQAELSSRLHYLRALHTQLQTAANKGPNPQVLPGFDAETNPDALVPHCRMLPDGRLALVLPDCLGTALCSGPPAPGALSFAPLLRLMGLVTRSVVRHHAPEKHHGSVRRTSTVTVPPQLSPAPALSPQGPPPAADLTAVLGWVRMVGAVIDALHDLHAHGLVHRALHPSTIAFNAAVGCVQFLDLGGSTRLTQTRADPQMRVDVTDLARFHFTSPEQTGKSLRVVDMRSDLYSLGALLFFLVTGRPPFQGSDAMEIMHAHLAKAPPTFKNETNSIQQAKQLEVEATNAGMEETTAAASSPCVASPIPSFGSTPVFRVRSALLSVLDAIVGKLLQKQAEDRYASVAGLRHDWNAIMEIMQQCCSSDRDSYAESTAEPDAAVLNAAAESLAAFRIGLLDVRSNFFVSQKLYGRSAQVQALLDSYQRVCGPRGGAASAGGIKSIPVGPGPGPPVAPHLFLVSGYSGVGKTSLVDALHKHIVRDHGLFARGKFDLLKRDSSCLLQAFRSMVQQMCAAADAIVWRVKIMKALGRNAAALIEVLPELAVLLGPQPPVPVLGASDTANRLNMTLMNFVGATATAATPMAIMIDDLQWADTGSLNTIKLLMSHERAHLLIIGAFRSNEVDAHHPLALLIAELKSTCRSDDADQPDQLDPPSDATDPSVVPASSCPRVCEVEVSPLNLDSVEQLVSDSFQCEPQDARALAQVLMDKTLGNPFFCQTVLHSWHEAGLLTFNFSTRRWEWQLGALARTAISSDVSDLVCRSMRSLSADCQIILQYAACSGHEVTMGLLRTVIPASITHDEMLRAVLTLERRGMLICTAHADDLALLTMRAASAEMHGTNADADGESAPRDLGGPSSSPSFRPSSPPPGLLLSRLSVITLQFGHDKIQAAALRLISPSDLPMVHCAIATQLLSAYDDAERDEFAVDIAGHVYDGVLACSSGLHTEGVAAWCRFFAGAQMVPKVISVMLCAAAHAKKASAYTSAIKFISAGISVVQHSQQLEAAGNTTLPPLFEISLDRSHVGTPNPPGEMDDDQHNGSSAAASSNSVTTQPTPVDGHFDRLPASVWQHSYSFCCRLYTELCFCAFLAGRARSSQLCIEYTLEHVVAIAERGQLWELHVQTLMVQGLMQEAVDTSLSYLRELGVELESEMSPELERWVVGQPPFNGANEATFHHHAVFKLENNPAPLAMNLLSAFTAALFFLKSALFPRVVWTMLNLTMRQGVTPESAFAFALYSMTLWGTHSRYTQNFSLGMVAKMLLDRFGEAGRGQAPRTNCAALGDIFPWRKPLRWCNQLIHGAFEEAFAMGDLEWGSYLGMYSAEMALLCGAPLGTAMIQQRAAHHALVKKKCTLIAQYCASWLECSQVLAGLVPVPTVMPSFDLPLIQFAACGARALMLTVLRRPREAQAVLELAVASKAANASLPSNIPFEFYSAQAKLAVMALDYESKHNEEQDIDADLRAGPRDPSDSEAASPVDRAAAATRLAQWTERLAGIDAHIGLLRIWRGVAPHTFEHKLLLVAAERHRVLIFAPAAPHLARWDLVGPAMALYERSASLAMVREYPLEAALALECAARFQDQLVGSALSPSGSKYWRNAMRLYGEAGAEAKVKQMQEEEREKAAAAKVPAWTTSGFAAVGPLAEASMPHAPSFLVRPFVMTSSRERDGWTSSGSSSSSSSCGTRTLRPHAASDILFELTKEEDEQQHDHMVAASGSDSNNLDRHSNSMGSTKWAVETSHMAPSISMCPPLTPDAARSIIAGSAASTAGSISSGSVSHSLVPVSSSAVAASTSTLLATLSVLKATASFFYETDESTLLQKLMSIVLETAGASSGVLVMQDAEDEQWRVELAASVDAQDAAQGIDQGIGANVWSQSRQPLNLHSDQRNFKPTEDNVAEINEAIISSDSAVVTSSSPSSSVPPLPLSVLQFVISSAESVSLSSPGLDPLSVWSSDPFFHRGGAVLPKAMLALPVLKGGVVSGVLLLSNHYRSDAFLDASVQLLQLLCTHAVLSIDNRRLYSQLSTHNRRLEQQVHDRTRDLQVAKERAEKATAVKADFLSAMSHEIRTPLNAVLGMARLLADSPLSLEQRQYVSAIDTSSLLLLTIINDILDFSKIEQSALKLHRKPQNMLEIAEAAFVMCGQMATTKGLTAAITVQPDIPPLLMVDATRLQQVLLNLLSNAVKFTAKGSVQLTVRIIEPPQDAPESAAPVVWLRFSVVDTGIGIKAEYVSQLGVSFVQLNPSSEYSGTGLGLVISKRLINAMGGSDIAVRSTFGKGSEFSCEIPFEVPPEKRKPSIEAHNGPGPRAVSAAGAEDAVSQRTLHGFLPSEVSVLKSTHVVALWSSNIATDSWLLMMRFYLASVTVFATVADFAAALRLEGSSVSASSSAAMPSRLRDALVVCDLDAPGVSEDDLQLAWHRVCGAGAVLRLTALYSKQYDTERMVEAAAGDPSVDGDGVGTPGAGSSSTVLYQSPMQLPRRITSAEPASAPASLPHRQLLRKPFRQAALLQSLLQARETNPIATTVSAGVASFAVGSSQLVGAGDSAVSRDPSSSRSSLNPVAASMSLPSVARRRIVSISASYPLRVLLCEDNLLNQKMMVMTMRRLGYEMVVCSNGQQALDALEAEAKKGRNSEIQVILMDVSMDVMSGLECTRIIRAQQLPNRCRPYIIAQTANVTDQAREACIQAGMDDFLPKPINVEELVQCIKQAHAQAQG